MKFSDLRLRARAFFMPRKVERELDEELAFHIECETRKLIADGRSTAEARQHALARFGALPLAATSAATNAGSPSSRRSRAMSASRCARSAGRRSLRSFSA